MSGVEVAGLVAGVVPVVIEILKSYRTAKDRLRTFKHHTQVIKDVRLRYSVAASNFSNDCQLLLKAIVGNAREVADMLEDPQHYAWGDPQLVPRFHAFLERDYILFEEITILIRDILRDTDSALKDCEAQHHGRRHTVSQRLYEAFDISRKENQYRRWLDTLDDWNGKLSKLRKQRCKLHKRDIGKGWLVRKALPRDYGDIRVASQSLHETLQDSWSCTNLSHTGHQAKLSLDTKADSGSVRLDVIIACRRNVAAAEPRSVVATSRGLKLTRFSRLSSERPIWLHVRSLTTPGPAAAQLPAPRMAKAIAGRVDDSPPLADEGSAKKRMKRKIKSVRFDAAADERYDAKSSKKEQDETAEPGGQQLQSYCTLDLKATASICEHLSQSCAPESNCADSCLGYLEYSGPMDPARLIFYDASKIAEDRKSRTLDEWETSPVAELLSSFQVLHQLTLAYRLSIAMLQYHSTSWLASDWSLQDVSYFQKSVQRKTDDISEQLQSLHLSTKFSGRKPEDLMKSHQAQEELKYVYGIRNLALAKLGVALVEIGCLSDIGSLATIPTPHDVITARKVLLNPPPSATYLGENYLRIARKCLECDFACGDDLTDDDLRDAVFTEVICGLESQVKLWKRFRGIK
jgi:hypothetical protein